MFTLHDTLGIIENHYHGIKIQLGVYEHRLLKFLLDNNGKTVHSDELIDIVWEGRVVSKGSLTKAINTLRFVMRDTPPFKIIINKPGVGYRINAKDFRVSEV